MQALASVESGGRYDAVNPVSGAYGKYQILPSTWRGWARVYLGNANLQPTPANQELMAGTVLSSAYWKLGSWPVVAFWWLTGKVEPNPATWSAGAKRYVDKVMAIYVRLTGAAPVVRSIATRTVPEWSSEIAYQGPWGAAGHRSYAGGQASFSAHPGATATLTFTGTQVTWVGPKGPTRGVVRVLVDGVEAAWVDLWAPRYLAKNHLFTSTLPVGQHSITLEVWHAPPGRPVVAIDAFLVRR
jgi:hypothetical protein